MSIVPNGFLVRARVAGQWRLAEVLESVEKFPETWYYVHFPGEDTRWDDWFIESDIERASGFELSSLIQSDDLEISNNPAPWSVLSSPSTACSLKDEERGPVLRTEFFSQLTARKPHRHTKTVSGIRLGCGVRLQAWFPSPYPLSYSDPGKDLYVCETCLRFFKNSGERAKHWREVCTVAHPPGDEIYRSDGISVFAVEGLEFPGYCERLLLLSKLFLEEKRVCSRTASQAFHVGGFTFFVLVKWREENLHEGPCSFVGYYSRLKSSQRDSNVLSCILTLPHQQRKGFGKFLITLSYSVAEIEGRRGSAERPLSPLGKTSFYSFWCSKVFSSLTIDKSHISLNELSELTGILPEDIAEALKDCGILKEFNKSVILLTHPEAIETVKKKAGSKGFPFRKEFLKYSPPVSFHK